MKDNKDSKIHELKVKAKESKITKKTEGRIQNQKEQNSVKKQELKLIKKLNKKPKGIASLKNTAGNILNVRDLEKTYVSGNTLYTAIKKANFSIKKGDFVVILGASGSGKSTLLNIISGLDRPTRGDVIVNNVNLSALKSRELTEFRRANVGFIFQSYNLLPSLNAKDNAEIGRSLQLDGNRRMELKDLFDKTNMANEYEKNIKNLSGGQQQRVSIIRALAKNPNIIFADEPTGALDSKTSESVIELLLEINKKYKTTIVIVTHDNSIIDKADKVLKVKDGRIEL